MSIQAPVSCATTWRFVIRGSSRRLRRTLLVSLSARPEHIAGYAQGIFVELAKERCLVGLDRQAFLERLTHYHAEMYAVHPFREGNTRSLRAFLGQLAGQAGHAIAWERLDHNRSFAANVQSLNGQNEQLRALLEQIVDPPVR
jgi:cell filamentation protein